MASVSLALTFALLGPPAPVIGPAGTAGEPAIAPADMFLILIVVSIMLPSRLLTGFR